MHTKRMILTQVTQFSEGHLFLLLNGFIAQCVAKPLSNKAI
ncbi:hypothetical protein M23134_00091 [Microscilla marina ATCC 23134]|uniref:Uncharacterized protein n=1 Tax=Microscilla marina ATCC 23134 TaxID=313606 RepID=A1ZKX1_MICM2|nr:hypothetical protein M23134_00091 [Microscilla marina ATCC 23134]